MALPTAFHASRSITRPIYTYDDSDIDKTVAEALKNVIPVCPNCHRIIHRNKLFSDAKIAALKASLSRKK